MVSLVPASKNLLQRSILFLFIESPFPIAAADGAEIRSRAIN